MNLSLAIVYGMLLFVIKADIIHDPTRLKLMTIVRPTARYTQSNTLKLQTLFFEGVGFPSKPRPCERYMTIHLDAQTDES